MLPAKTLDTSRSTRAKLSLMAKVRAPTHALTRTYVRLSQDSHRYQATTFLPDKTSKSCTRDELDDAVRCSLGRVGVKRSGGRV